MDCKWTFWQLSINKLATLPVWLYASVLHHDGEPELHPSNPICLFMELCFQAYVSSPTKCVYSTGCSKKMFVLQPDWLKNKHYFWDTLHVFLLLWLHCCLQYTLTWWNVDCFCLFQLHIFIQVFWTWSAPTIATPNTWLNLAELIKQEPRGSSHDLEDYLDHIWRY